MNPYLNKKIKYKLSGLKCASCEVLIERNLKKIHGINEIKVNHLTGEMEICCQRVPANTEIEHVLQKDGYTLITENETNPVLASNEKQISFLDYAEVGAIFLIIISVYYFLKQLDLIPTGFNLSANLSYFTILMVGLVAATSTCLAVAGGLLLAIAGKYNEANPQATGIQKFKPHLYFNIGRIAGYTIFGGIIGAIGSGLSISPKLNGIITIGASLVMVILGLELLQIFPGLKRFIPKMPKFIAHKLYDASSNNKKSTPFLFGASTFFLPCGFTQALQLYVLSEGDIKKGALTMLVFSLGTLPALLSVGAISSFAKGLFQRYFLKFSGALVILLGLFNLPNGFNLYGINVKATFIESNSNQTNPNQPDSNIKVENGVQIAEMKVKGLNYSPSKFRITKGMPVEWRIDGKNAVGCAQVITAPKLGITKYLAPDEITKITFTPEKEGIFNFSCTMGMTTPGAAFEVVSTPSVANSIDKSEKNALQKELTAIACDPNSPNCAKAQKLSMEVTDENWFYPNRFTVKKGIPVELEIDTQIPLGGCMGTLVIPEYKIAHLLSLGKTTLKFTPKKEGTFPFTCSMGVVLGTFTVTS